MTDRIVFTTPLDPLTQPLFDQPTRGYLTRYGRPPGTLPGTAMRREPLEFFAPPDGTVELLLRDGRPMAGGAFKRHDPSTAGLTRVWTDTAFRRQGLARQIIETLEAQAARQGCDRLCLMAGFREPEARGLYRQLGYTPRFDVTVDPEVYKLLPFEKVLRPTVVPLRRPPGRRAVRHASRARALSNVRTDALMIRASTVVSLPAHTHAPTEGHALSRLRVIPAGDPA